MEQLLSLLSLWLLMSLNLSPEHPPRQARLKHGLKSSYPISAAMARLLFKVIPLKEKWECTVSSYSLINKSVSPKKESQIVKLLKVKSCFSVWKDLNGPEIFSVYTIVYDQIIQENNLYKVKGKCSFFLMFYLHLPQHIRN